MMKLAEPFPGANDAVALLRSIAPLDFPPDWPLYLLSTADLPEGACRMGSELVDGCLAFTDPCASLFLEPLLSRAGAWRGGGFCAVFCADVFASRAGIADVVHALGVETLLHEAAHQIDRVGVWPRTVEVDGTAATAEISDAELAALLPRYDMSALESVAAQPAFHGLRFVRAALHLEHRARRLTRTAGTGIIAGNPVPTPQWDRLRFALQPEFDATAPARKSIRDILDAPPPAEFVAVWEEFGTATPEPISLAAAALPLSAVESIHPSLNRGAA